MAVFTPDMQKDLLQKTVNDYVKHGWIVMTQTDTSAQLVKHKRFSLLLCILGFGIFYLLWHALITKDQHVYLTVNDHGKIQRRNT